MLLDTLVIGADAFTTGTGWAVKPEGVCHGEVCVPLPEGMADGGKVHVDKVAAHLGMALVADERRGVWALGPASAIGTQRLTTLDLPDLVLTDFDGAPFALRSLRGQKVVLINWASW